MHFFDKIESGVISHLPKYGLVQVSGEDAVSFIHGQLSQDIANLKMNEIRFAGYCLADGLLFATLFVWKSDQNVFLLVPQTILPSLLKRLQIFILRSKVKLTDVSQSYSVAGLIGKNIEKMLLPKLTELPKNLYEKKEYDQNIFIKISDAFDAPRFLWISPQKNNADLSKNLHIAQEKDWELTEIDAGMPEIDSSRQNRFLPQEINMDRIGGISFTKGCYPGQEIIAKCQRQNMSKRRMIRAYADIPNTVSEIDLSSYTAVFESNDENPCGILFQAVFRDKNCIDCLLIVSHNAIASKSLRLGSPDGLVLHQKALPYSLSDE